MKLLDLVHADCIIADLASADRNTAIRELAQILADAHHLANDAVEGIVKSIIARERTRGTTGFGKGMAIPHAKIEGLDHIAAAVGRSSRGVDFASLDGEPAFVVFLIISPADQPEEHLRAMDLVFRSLQQETFRKFLRQATSTSEIYELLKEADEKLLMK